jgi:hypothetical protein
MSSKSCTAAPQFGERLRLSTGVVVMIDTLLITEIEEKYPSEWILLEDPQTGDDLKVKSGKVLWHSPDRDEVYQKAIELRPQHSAFLYTGTIPDDMEFVL